MTDEDVRRAQTELRQQAVQLLRDPPRRRRLAVGLGQANAGPIVGDGSPGHADLAR